MKSFHPNPEINEVFQRCREQLKAWAARLTEEEKRSLEEERQLDEPYYGDTPAQQLATCICAYEEQAKHAYQWLGIKAHWVGEDGKIDFTETFTLPDLIAETVAEFQDEILEEDERISAGVIRVWADETPDQLMIALAPPAEK
jgi:hypothetical protein